MIPKRFIKLIKKNMADRNVRIVSKAGKKPQSGQYAKTASQAFDKNSLVEFAGGYINPTDDNDTVVFGIITEEVATTDSDYASATKKSVDLIQPGDEVEMDTSAALTVGTSYGVSNAYTVDQTDTTNKVFTCLKVVSSSRAIGYLKSVAGDAVI